ncbi:MAG: hypothetical protein IKC13_01885 [Elusimicrobiaceae bacterium]|nr:hypothetical protein [Elusimicrobiaceae bacterium]
MYIVDTGEMFPRNKKGWLKMRNLDIKTFDDETGNLVTVQTHRFDDEEIKKVFDLAFSLKSDYFLGNSPFGNSPVIFFIDGIQILQDWMPGDPKIKSFAYRNFFLTNGIQSEATNLIRYEALFLHGCDSSVVNYGKNILDSLNELKKNIEILEDAINEAERSKKDE